VEKSNGGCYSNGFACLGQDSHYRFDRRKREIEKKRERERERERERRGLEWYMQAIMKKVEGKKM